MNKLTAEQELELEKLREEILSLREKLRILSDTIGFSEYVQESYTIQYNSSGLYEDTGKPRIGLYHADINRNPNYEQWKDTFFYTNPYAAQTLGRNILTERSISRLRHAQKYHPPFVKDCDYMYGLYLVSTEAVIGTPYGPRFVFADPYGSIITDPCSEIDMDYAESLIGKIVFAEIGHRFNSSQHPLKKLRLTGYDKYESNRK